MSQSQFVYNGPDNYLFHVLNTISIPIFVLEEDKTPCFINHSGQNVLQSQKQVLLRTDGTLRFSDQSDEQRFQELFKEIMDCRGIKGSSSTRLFSINSDEDERSIFHLQNLCHHKGKEDNCAGNHKCCCMLTILDSSPPKAVDTTVIKNVFGLTSAEARLASTLLRGQSTTDHAEKYKVSKNTVRVQMQSILQKTGCRKQAEFISFASKLFLLDGKGSKGGGAVSSC